MKKIIFTLISFILISNKIYSIIPNCRNECYDSLPYTTQQMWLSWSKLVLGQDEQQNFQQNEIQLHPNPTNDVIEINIPREIRSNSIKIYDFMGKQVFERAILEKDSFITVPMSKHQDGLYFLVIKTIDGTVLHKYFIIRR